MRPMAINTSNKASKKVLLKLTKYLKPYRFILITSWVFSITGSIFSVLGPRYLGKITTHCSIRLGQNLPFDFSYIGKISIILIVLYVSSALFTYLSNYLTSGAVQRSTKKIRDDITVKINKLPLRYFDSKEYGDILSIVTNDVDTISQNLNQSLNQIVYSISMLIGVIAMMLTTSYILTVVAVISLPLSAIFMGIIMKSSQKYFREQQIKLGKLNGHIEEAYTGHLVVKAFNKEDDNYAIFEDVNNELTKTAFYSQFLSGLIMPILSFVGNLSYIAIAVVGGRLIITNNTSLKLNFGDVQSFIQYLRMFNQPISQIGQISNVLQSCSAATERVMKFLDEEELEVENKKSSISNNLVKGDVSFENVKFGYTSEKEIIHDFSCEIKRGQKVAIVGPTGAGKTTIVNLLMRFYEINSGQIKIDGIPTTDLSRESVAGLFGMVLQDSWLFEDTIFNNLVFGNQNATYEDVKKACKACHVHHFIKALPNGYDFIIDENANISQGQKQLLTIARAMIQNAPMLILDEATSSVDTRTEALIQNAMDKLMHNRTSFVIAHRLSTIKNADIILVMKNGNIVESGNHQDLLERKGFYFELYNSQFSENK